MNTNILKILKVLVALIAVVAAYFFIRIVSAGDDAIIEAQSDGGLGIVGPFVYFTTWLLIIIAAVTVVFSIVGLLKKPAALKKTLIGLVVLGIVLGVSYGIASDEAVYDLQKNVLEGGEAGAPSKWVSTGIWYTLLLGAGAIAAIVIGGVKSIIK